jgi:ABC-type sugar transport system substrate-binding protein
MSHHVVVSLPEGENEFQILQGSDAYTTASRLGLEVDVLYADNNAVQQIQQLFKVIHAEEPPKAILVEPVALAGLERVAQKAVQAGIGWGVLNCTVDHVATLRTEYPNLPIFCLGSDQVEIGRIQARQMRLLLPDGGCVLYIHGPRSASAARERFQGVQEGLAGSQIRTIVLDGQWTEESSENVVKGWLRLTSSETVRIDLVAAQDDSMARGARRAIDAIPEAAAWRNVPYLGIDGVPEVGQKLVAAGQLTATVVMPSNVGPALEVVDRWRKSGKQPPASVFVGVRSLPDEEQLKRAASRAGNALAG